MRGKNKTTLFLGDPTDKIKFLNSSAEDFYRGAFIFVGKHYDFANKFKSDILYFIVEFERVIEATFHSELNLKNVDLKRFKQMFPNICKMYSIKSIKDIVRFGKSIHSFRNLNAHSLPAMSDYDVFNEDCNFLSKQTRFNQFIHYLTDDGKLTVAGMIFIILNCGREESIKSLTTKNKIIGIVSKGSEGIDAGENFVKKVSNVDWKIKIRQDSKKTISHAVFGDLYDEATTGKKNMFLYSDEKNDSYNVRIEAEITSNSITVSEHSISHVFYEDTYKLSIKNKVRFLELANQFPPFVIVDLLYKLGITEFTEDVYQALVNDEKKWSIFTKPMYPKFYVDKNIDILLADSSLADLRITSNVCNGGLTGIFLKLEKLIIKYFNIPLSKIYYSRIGYLLKYVTDDEELIEKVNTIRNLSSHGYILGEYVCVKKELVCYDLKRIVPILTRLVELFATKNAIVYNALSNDIQNLFIKQILSIKMKKYVEESVKFINDYPHTTNEDELRKKELFYKNSHFDHELFKELNEKIRGDYYYIIIKTSLIDCNLVLYNMSTNNYALEKLLNLEKEKIKSECISGVVKYLTLGD